MSEEQQQQEQTQGDVNPPSAQAAQTQEQTGTGCGPVMFAVIGFILGVPLSYLFQSELVRAKVPFEKYIGHAPQILFEAWNTPVGSPGAVILVTCVVCALLLGFIGSNKSKS